jgi:hypothetical protein
LPESASDSFSVRIQKLSFVSVYYLNQGALHNRDYTTDFETMGLLNFFKKKVKVIGEPDSSNEGTFGWSGKDFEFLITGAIDNPANDYDQIMTPNSLEWIKVVKGYTTTNYSFLY